FMEHTDNIRAGWLSPDGSTAATCGNDSVIRVWDVKTGRGLRVIRPGLGFLGVLAVTPDGQHAVAAGQPLTVIDLITGEKLRTIDPPTGVVAVHPDGKHVLTAENGNVRM